MPRHQISGDAAIRAVKLGDGRSRLSDGDGLYLRLFVNGASHGWRFDFSIAGKRNTLSLGTYPDVGLAAARRRADEVRRSVADGIDPSTQRKAGKNAVARQRIEDARADAGLAPLGSFEAVAREWLETIHAAKVSPGHAKTTRERLEQNVFPWLGRVQIADIKPPALLECLRRVEARGANETAHRIRQACGQIFRFGIASGLCERDSAADLRDALRPVETRHHSAITDPQRTGALLRAMDDYRGQHTTRVALRLAALVFLRPGELRQAEWSEVDLEEGNWTIPAQRMKGLKATKANGPPHLVPLSKQAIAAFEELKPLTGSGRYVFPSLRKGGRPMSNNAVLTALRTMGFPKEEMSGHGFRAMARTMLAERLDVPEAVIEAQLAHSVPDALGRAYNRTEFLEQRRKMMQLWADYLDHVKIGLGLPRHSA